MNKSYIIKGVCALLLGALVMGLPSCRNTEAVVPTDAQTVSETARIYPDYRDVTIPPNIAPLNVQVKSPGDAFVGCIEGQDSRLLLLLTKMAFCSLTHLSGSNC